MENGQKSGCLVDISVSLTDILATQLENMSNVSHAPRGVVDILIKLVIFFKLVQHVALI